MQPIEEEIIIENGYNLHLIPSKKYKTINMIVKFKAPLERTTVTERALLPYILQQGTEKYPSARELRTALDDLFGTVFTIDSAKKGESHIITARMEVANQAYLTSNVEIIKEALALLNQIIFHPKGNKESFDEKIVNREKQTLKQKIDSVIDDKMSYANMRLIDEMCQKEPYQLHVQGYEEDLEAIDAKNLFDYYRTMLVEDELDIYVLGDLGDFSIQELIATYFAREKEDRNQPNPTITQKIADVKEIVEAQNVQQGKLHLGYRTNITFSDPLYPALQVFNGIFGGFPSSKLFMNVREKHSLAYYASSRFESHKGLLFVFSGIDPKDYKQAKNIIIEQMEAMQSGDFSDDQVEETKQMVVNQFLETLDHPQGLIEVLYHQILADLTISPEELMAKIKQVKKQDILEVGKRLELDTVYFLTSQGGNSIE
ncbi:EF-P 5-aminopentanol modification-associated protein YfmF [Aquibacillus salsiterrae]|uniref:Insulinase family protein n=1 Tax=Aquibacillus salsiterrae TaxID=2950439 RepID=A0A9X3WBP9_9BACI|nr:pitrilysin family protein [Aquibacillus salsiterrae]MDC3416337.1 insulinase family protein [Aquibacillus salsiterrae]